MYRVYLRYPDAHVSDKTTTENLDVAIEAFEALVNRRDLDGQKLLVSLTKNGRGVVHHAFDAPKTSANYWRGRIDQLPLHRESGRPVEIKNGKRINIYLDAPSVDAAKRCGDGNISAGIRRALKIAADLIDPK